MRVLVSCANGSGTSLMLLQTATKALTALGYKVTASNHTSIAEGKSTAKNYDVVFTPLNFINMFDEAAKQGVTIIGVRNVMSLPECKQRIEESDLASKNLK